MTAHTGHELEEKEIRLAAHPSNAQGESQTIPSKADADVAVSFLANLDPAILNEPISSKEARKALWKIDLIILPLVAFSVIISAVDKVIISNAAIYGMRADTHLVGDQFSWVASTFYFGYLGFEWPANLLIQRLPLRTFYACTVMGWAILTFCTGATQNFGGLTAVRFLMGALEAVVFPTCTIVSAMWWTRKEQPIRVAIWFNTLSSVITGLLSYGVGNAHTSVAPWRLLFIVLGALTTVWAVLLYVFLPSSPIEAWWLTDREKYICIERVRGNNTGIEDKTIKWYQVKECLMDPKPWLISIFACSQNIPNGGLVTFAAIIVTGLGFDPLTTTLLGVPTGVIATIWQIALALISARLDGWRCAIIAMAQAFPIVSSILMWQLQGRTSRLNLLGAYYGFYSYWAPYVLCTSLPLANTSGHSKKVTANAMFFIGYCLGNILGPQVFRASDAPDYRKGYIGLLACFIVSAITISVYGLLCRQENRRRDKAQSAPNTTTDGVTGSDAFSDKTDKEKPEFRYDY